MRNKLRRCNERPLNRVEHGGFLGWLGMLLEFLASRLAAFLTKATHSHGTSRSTDLIALARALKPGDVLLVEGNNRISTAIKYLTQSTWSHAALYVGDAYGKGGATNPTPCFVEADVVEGVRAVSLETFKGFHCRICRPVGLSVEDAKAVVGHAIACVGHRYDLRNVFDLARYLIPTPPVASGWRRRMIAMGSGDPTRAICSTLIAQAFGSINYPILPTVSTVAAPTPECPGCHDEILRVRHHSLYVPADFDVSPYFQVIKPTLEGEFDFHTLKWAA